MCCERSSTFLPPQYSDNLEGWYFWSVSEFLPLVQRLNLWPLLSPPCSAGPTSFIPQRDTNTGLPKDFKVTEGNSNTVQNRYQLKMDYWKCSWPLRISSGGVFFLDSRPVELAFPHLHAYPFLPRSSLQTSTAHATLLSFQQINST